MPAQTFNRKVPEVLYDKTQQQVYLKTFENLYNLAKQLNAKKVKPARSNDSSVANVSMFGGKSSKALQQQQAPAIPKFDELGTNTHDNFNGIPIDF